MLSKAAGRFRRPGRPGGGHDVRGAHAPPFRLPRPRLVRLQPERNSLSGHDLDPEAEALASFLYEMGLLKRVRRAGWLVAGVANPETIAEHTFRTAIIGYVLAVLEGADAAKTVLLCLFHDTQETRIGDVPYVGRPYVTTVPNAEVTSDQVRGLPPAIGEAVRALVSEFEAGTSLEARIAEDADKLECLVQAREYQAQGYEDVPPWIENSAAGLQSSSARRLAQACQQVPPNQWCKSLNEGLPR
jgi:putative hydrolases of HD superfamily